ncbi:hypothetical protein GW17_00029760, partial [Ensete ventricosum]
LELLGECCCCHVALSGFLRVASRLAYPCSGRELRGTMVGRGIPGGSTFGKWSLVSDIPTEVSLPNEYVVTNDVIVPYSQVKSNSKSTKGKRPPPLLVATREQVTLAISKQPPTPSKSKPHNCCTSRG